MDLIALAVPFFLIALLVELAVDRVRGTGYYRTSDAINSLSAGTLSTTIGYFTRLFPAAIWAFVLQGFALIEVDLAWFDMSARASHCGCWRYWHLIFVTTGRIAAVMRSRYCGRRMRCIIKARTTTCRRRCDKQARASCSAGYFMCRYFLSVFHSRFCSP